MPHPILVTIPHCSYFIPAHIKKLMVLNEFDIKKQSDLYTDLIFEVDNAYVVKSKISRLVADVNRAPDDIEMENKLCADGVAISINEDGKQIYKERPNFQKILNAIDKYHYTFHEKVERLEGKVSFLIDGHSYLSKGPVTKIDAGKQRADVTLGNRSFTTCDRRITKKIEGFFKEKGFSTSINFPYSGKYVIGYHCSRRNLPGIQIEFNRKLYMNEKTLEPKMDEISKLNAVISELVELLAKEFDKSNASNSR